MRRQCATSGTEGQLFEAGPQERAGRARKERFLLHPLRLVASGKSLLGIGFTTGQSQLICGDTCFAQAASMRNRIGLADRGGFLRADAVFESKVRTQPVQSFCWSSRFSVPVRSIPPARCVLQAALAKRHLQQTSAQIRIEFLRVSAAFEPEVKTRRFYAVPAGAFSSPRISCD